MDIQKGDYQKAVAVVRKCSSGSVSNIQRKLYWGYARAASAIDRMQDEFIVSPMSASGRRDVYPEEIHDLWKELQAAKAQAIPEGFVLVPKELSDSAADNLAMNQWEVNKTLLSCQFRDLNTFEFEKVRLNYCEKMANKFKVDYKTMIEAAEGE